jgi:hypothetical protein
MMHSEDIKLYDHALVLVMRSLLGSWIQPIGFGCFAYKNGASPAELQSIVTKALVALESKGAKVIAIASDGASTNGALWKLCVSSRGLGDDEPRHFIHHPITETRVCEIRDPQNLVKCFRNFFFKDQYVQVVHTTIE